MEFRQNYSLPTNSEYISNTHFVTIGAFPLLHIDTFEGI